MVSNESVDYRATFPEGMFQFIVLRNTYAYTSLGWGTIVYFWFCLYVFTEIWVFLYKSIGSVYFLLPKKVFHLTQNYMTLIFR